MSTSKRKKFYVTTPIYYGTAKPHLGSLYSTLLADFVARWNKLKGNDVFFLTGTDEHGQKIADAAQKVGKDPKEFVDSFVNDYKKTWQAYEIDYTKFIRTTDDYHVKAVQQWIRDLQQKGDIYKSMYEGWYCTPCETFVTAKDIPVRPELVEGSPNGSPRCPSCSRETHKVHEETYFFKLSAYQDKLLEFYKNNPDWVVPKERLNEVIAFVKSGLKDLSISRTTVKWGISFPDDNEHVAYVWADALNNYITAIGYGQEKFKKDFAKWWPADLQIMGKDIIRFHAIYWPAFLMALDLPLPKKLLVHGWIKIGEQKMSKSLGNVVDPMNLLKAYGADPVRYYLIRKMAITHDSPFSIQDLEQTITSDLANDLGNLLSRMVSLADKHGIYELLAPKTWSADALKLQGECVSAVKDFYTYMDEYNFHMVLARLWKYINQVNAFFHSHEPWKLVKTDRDTFLEILCATAQSLRTVGLLLWPAMPNKMEKLLKSIGVVFSLDHNTIEELELCNWNHNFMLTKIPPLFVKPEVKKVTEQPKEQEKKAAPVDDIITIDAVAKVQLLVGAIDHCEEVAESEKLLKMTVNFGEKGTRQIFAGIKKQYTPEDLIGKQSVFVYNLKPRKMMGMESQGMMLLAKDADGKLQRIAPVEKVENGTRLC